MKIVVEITFRRAPGRAFDIELAVIGGPGAEAIHIPVVHAKGGGDQNGVVDLAIGGPGLPCCRDHFGGDVLPAFLDGRGDG